MAASSKRCNLIVVTINYGALLIKRVLQIHDGHNRHQWRRPGREIKQRIEQRPGAQRVHQLSSSSHCWCRWQSSRQLVTAEEDGQETPEESRVRFSLFVSPSLSAISADTRLIRRPGRLAQDIILVIGLTYRDGAGAGREGVGLGVGLVEFWAYVWRGSGNFRMTCLLNVANVGIVRTQHVCACVCVCVCVWCRNTVLRFLLLLSLLLYNYILCVWYEFLKRDMGVHPCRRKRNYRCHYLILFNMQTDPKENIDNVAPRLPS